VPARVTQAKCAQYTRRGKPAHLPQRVNDQDYSIVAQYQAEYRGLVQYYRPAYNLHRLGRLKRVMETSLVKTLAKKHKTTCARIYARYQARHETDHGTAKVLAASASRGPDKAPLVAHFGGIPLRSGVNGVKWWIGSWPRNANCAAHQRTSKPTTSASSLICGARAAPPSRSGCR
jgi:hypothetical protein